MTHGTLYTRQVESPLGPITLFADDAALVAVYLPNHKEDHKGFHPEDAAPVSAGAHSILDSAAVQLQAYFAGERMHFELPLSLDGTGFQESVWRALEKIPYGQTCSYGQLADRIGRPGSARAVGAANGRNPISIILPCHRVVGASGSLTGYAAGTDAKAWLLAHEAHVAAVVAADPA